MKWDEHCEYSKECLSALPVCWMESMPFPWFDDRRRSLPSRINLLTETGTGVGRERLRPD